MEDEQRLESLAQARYERTLLNEITKLQSALADERQSIAQQKAEMHDQAAAAHEKKTAEAEKASRLAAMEKSILAAQKDEQKEFLKKREVAERRMRQQEAEAAKKRDIEARKKEQHRQLAAKLHEETMARATEERMQAEESKRIADQKKEAKLRQRLADEREALQERNQRKAEESAEKVQRAAEQRVKMTETQRQAYSERTRAQQQRMAAQKMQQEQRIGEIRAAADIKMQVIARAQQQQQALEEQRRNTILQSEYEKQQRLDMKAAQEAEAREQLAHEKVLQEAAARNRVERTMGDLQAQLYALEGQLDARSEKVEAFCDMRQSFVNEGQRLSVQSALERSQLANSMERMRSNLTNNNTLYLELPKNRRKVTNPELTSLLKRVDPEETCTIPLSNMRKTLTKLLPPKQELARKPKRFTSNSLPSLLTLEQKNELSRYDQFVAAFKAVDADGSGSISKRELYQVLKKAGLDNGKAALEVFNGFDVDDDGSLDFEEFTKIAKILC